MNTEISRRPVFVTRGSTTYHSRMDCPELRRSLDDGVDWCSAGDAHHSSLSACPACAAVLLAQLSAQVGHLPHRDRHRRGVPRLKRSPLVSH